MRRLRPGVPGRRHHAGRRPAEHIAGGGHYPHFECGRLRVAETPGRGAAHMLAALPEVETHQSSASKIVIVMEAAESGTMGGRLAEIASWRACCRPTWCFPGKVGCPRCRRLGAMSLSRRRLKAQAAAVATPAPRTAAAAAGVSSSSSRAAGGGVQRIARDQMVQSAVPVRCCGTGCGVMVGVKAGKGCRHPRRYARGG